MSSRVPAIVKGSPILIGLVIVAAIIGMRSFKTVPPGHTGVATLFGSVREQPFNEGLHFPVNPLYEWSLYDARQKTHLEQANVPSQDQLQTKIDVSVQYRLTGPMTPQIKQDTGTAADMVKVHLVPTLRSLVREQGKSIKRAEDFFQEQTQE